jgi:predicted DNA-binding protein (MmcQ/YjbR family)/ActR/RegA family two-component response regulator
VADLASIESHLRKTALAYPDSYEEKPWGERVTKVKGKIFLFAGMYKGSLSVTTKIPSSATLALSFPFAQPTGYGLGKSGWITSRFGPDDDVPTDLLLEWLDESYRNVAPKKLVKALDGRAAAPVRPAAEKSAGDVLVVGRDPLRLRRAASALEERGLRPVLATPEDALAKAPARPAAVVIDLGRTADDGLELGAALGATALARAPLVFAGVRDAAMAREARRTRPASCLREPPGDPAAADEVARIAGRAGRAGERSAARSRRGRALTRKSSRR